MNNLLDTPQPPDPSPNACRRSLDDGVSQGHAYRFKLPDEVQATFSGFALSAWRNTVYRVGCVLSLGALYLLTRWMPRYRIRLTMVPRPLNQATWVSVENEYGQFDLLQVQNCDASSRGLSFNSNQRHNSQSFVDDRRPYFVYRHQKYLLSPHSTFPTPPIMLARVPFPQPIAHGLDTSMASQLLQLYDENMIRIPIPSTFTLLINEILHPFYIFQIASILLWCIDAYYYYAMTILIISVGSAISTLIETKRNLLRLRDMSQFSCKTRVLRDSRWIELDSRYLVPGDIIAVEGLGTFPVDAVLLKGEAIVNEAMLTGESVPVSKIPVKKEEWDLITQGDLAVADMMKLGCAGRSVLFGGTRIVKAQRGVGAEQVHGYDVVPENEPCDVVAMVCRTGFYTTRGHLTLSMMYPRPHEFHFYRDSFRFIAVLFVIAIIGFLASIYFLVLYGADWTHIVLKALDLITIVVPPGLPAAMSIGTSFALARLKKNQVFCISPPRVNVSGKVEIWCFDKTGTLTEEGLNVRGVRLALPAATSPIIPISPLATEKRLGDMIKESVSLRRRYSEGNKRNLLEYALATCHGLKVVHGEIIGDPLDVRMFEWTRWTLDDVASRDSGGVVGLVVRPPGESRMNFGDMLLGNDDEQPEEYGTIRSARRSVDGADDTDEEEMIELGVLRVFEFVSSLRRMSVIVRELRVRPNLIRGGENSPTPPIGGAGDMFLFTKGAPESLLPLCEPSSIPSDLNRVLDEYTHSGYRVLLLASKPVKGNFAQIIKAKREQMEKDLTFEGVLVFENKIKEGTKRAIDQLSRARIRSVMCTGDNILTAIAVGKECGMIKPDSRVFIPRVVDETSEDAENRRIANDVVALSLSEDEDGVIEAEEEEPEKHKRIIWESLDGQGVVLDAVNLKPIESRPSSVRASGPSISNSASHSSLSITNYATGCSTPSLSNTSSTASLIEEATRVSPAPNPITLAQKLSSYLLDSQSESKRSSGNGVTTFHSSDSDGQRYDLAVTGEAFEVLLKQHPSILRRVLHKATIYARMSPEQKHELVERLQEDMEFCVGFCGDGANDCGALKAADVGLSLSEAEASVAAPFTSCDTDLKCVLRVVREGRAALVTSFSCFKYMALYSLIQFTSVIMMYSIGNNLGDSQFLYVDLFLIMPVAVFMGYSGPYKEIHRKAPTSSLVSRKVLVSVIGQVIIQMIMQVWVFLWVQSQKWYESPRPHPGDPFEACWENTAVFLISSFQYVIVAVVFTVGPPYREPMTKNLAFMGTVFLLTLFTVFVTLEPPTFMLNILQLKLLPMEARLFILFLCALDLVASIGLEKLLTPYIVKALKHVKKREKKKMWRVIANEMDRPS